MNRRWSLLLVGALLTGASGCSGENYRSLYEVENTVFNELNDYLMLVVDEESAKEFNLTHGRKITDKFSDISKKLEGWEKLYSVDKDAMKVYTEMKLCLTICRVQSIRDLKPEELEGLDDAGMVYRLVRDGWANSDRYDKSMGRIQAIKSQVQAKNEVYTELDKCMSTNASSLLYMGAKKAQGFGALLIPQLEKGSKVKVPERFKKFMVRPPGFGP